MSNYIKSEIYRVLHSLGTYMFIIICSALLISSNIVLFAVKCAEPDFPYATTAFSISNIISSFIFIFILCMTVGSMIFAKEHSNHTMKNSVSYGISRGTLYFGKLIVAILYSIVAFAIIVGLHVASAYLLLEHSNVNELEVLLRTSFVSLPLLLFALAATNCFSFIIEGSGAAIGAEVGLLIAFPIISQFLGMKFEVFRKLSKVLPWCMLNNLGLDMDSFTLVLPWAGNSGYYNYWLAGSVQMILITVIGLIIFRKKEIK
jgi:ABC-type transport system involved in multi-copper enzyme maturation permease subunit